MRLRRSTLNFPGNNEDKAKHVISSNVDVVMFDLEDTVPESKKAEARQCTAYMLSEFDFRGKVTCVRINGWDTEHAIHDVNVILKAGVEEIKMTKCETVEEVLQLDSIIAEYEKKKGLPKNSIVISMMIESLKGVKNSYQILSCTDRIAAVSLGAGDLASELGVDRDIDACSLQLLYIKQKLALSAHAAGIRWVLDTSLVTKPGQTPVEAIETLIKDCTHMKTMGYTGRSAVYLEHIDTINNIFFPSTEEIQFALKAVDGWQKMKETGDESYLIVNDRHLDIGKVEKAMRVVSLADSIK